MAQQFLDSTFAPLRVFQSPAGTFKTSNNQNKNKEQHLMGARQESVNAEGSSSSAPVWQITNLNSIQNSTHFDPHTMIQDCDDFSISSREAESFATDDFMFVSENSESFWASGVLSSSDIKMTDTSNSGKSQ